MLSARLCGKSSAVSTEMDGSRHGVGIGFGPLQVMVREQLFVLNQRRRLRRIARYWHPSSDPSAMLEAVRRKTLVVTVSAGRSGTTYLARLLAAFPQTTSLHEAAPHYAFFMRQAQHSRAAARRFLLEYKLPCVAAAPTARYADISHLFCKGFLEPLLELGIVPRVVMLRRDPRLVARSWLTRRVIPGRWKRGLKLHLHPGDPGVLPFARWWRASDYQLCFWYALEMERRQERYAVELARRGLPAIDVTAEELHDPARFLSMAATLGLADAAMDLAPVRRGHAELSARVHNPNRVVAGEDLDLDAEEAAVWDALGAAGAGLRDRIAERYAPVAPPRRAQGGSST